MTKGRGPARAPARAEQDVTDGWCFSWPEMPPASPGKDRLGLLMSARWQTGAVIPVSFLDGDAATQREVKALAQTWVGADGANLTFKFVKRGGVVRISFKFRGAWSAIGKTCLNVTDPARPTMNLGGISAGAPLEQFRRTVLHEFGHVLGLVHEHATPAADIKWNRAQVERELQAAPYFWTRQQVRDNLFKAFTERETNFTAFDPKSIMLYPIPKRWTRDGFSSTLNLGLSAKDRQTIRRWYPHD